ncbi:MAG: pyruvate kinase [Gammaproteobacteria bacterium CG_4_10_14_0_8_um_filter_38_16]|nr:MAG: pyruvate kinase [Gammaproteobacteria bacterium CG_4_10_14_0_8_um_filter_38_16]PJA03848.1 MAG: pyruvate kinase [Gammaproteobacteria bacterium CG_4_10_14_0_2_um_filter_38_22]
MITHEEHFERRTKILATLGPATDSAEKMEKLIQAGVNCVRLNFSHGTHADHQKRIELVRAVAKKLNRIIGILGDLQGPKIRIAQFVDGKIYLKPGDLFVLDAEMDSKAGTQKAVGIDYKALPDDLISGDLLLLNDGLITLRVEKVDGPRVICLVEQGGELSNHKGINKKGGGLTAKALTEKDLIDLKFAVKMDVDYIALSFPRNAQDVHEARALIQKENGTSAIISKIERVEAVENIDEIIIASDGVMVARGDLAVEIGDAEVPMVQKNIIQRARTLDKPVIIATQMMESMIHSPVPTRAEVSDVANAVLDHADCVMCSAETATGEFPIETIESMARVCRTVEKQPKTQQSKHRVECEFKRIDEAIAMATMYTANHFNVRAVVALTESGATPLWMSRIRTRLPIYGLSRFARTLGKMTLFRGIYPLYFDVTDCSRDEVNAAAITFLEKNHFLQKNDRVILTKGDHLGRSGGSNAMKILIVGETM